MSSKSIKETLGRTKKLFHKTFQNLKKSLAFVKHPSNHPSPSDVKREIDNNINPNYSEKWEANAFEVKKVRKVKESQVSSKVQPKKDDKVTTRSISFASCRGLDGFKEDKNARKLMKPKETSFRGADALAKKMKDLEMMGVHDMDQELDVEEVLHYYSRLKCPSYVEIVDNFFTDMYSDFHNMQPSRSGSMRRVGRASAHSSMRSLGPLKL